MQREREDYAVPDLADQNSGRQQWLTDQRAAFDSLAAAAAVGTSASAAAAGGGSNGGTSGGGGEGQRARHGAIFRLVYGLLEGPLRRGFGERYLPWLNDLAPQRLDNEFSTLHAYLRLLDDMPWQAVQGLMQAYLRAILDRVGVGGVGGSAQQAQEQPQQDQQQLDQQLQ